MARVEARAGRGRKALTAAAPVAPARMLPTYDMAFGDPVGRYFNEQAMAAGISNFHSDRWPCDIEGLEVGSAEFVAGSDAVFRSEGALTYVSLRYGWMNVHVAASDLALAAPIFAAFRKSYPASYMTAGDDPRVPITFWANSKHGPTARLRKIDSALWDDITSNYSAEVRSQLSGLMDWQNGPPSKDGGQLILWQGPPGTGKSWGLRALASTWAPWAEFHYITDPDSFFVDDPSYMIEVLLADSYEAIDEPTGDVFNEQRDGKWRVLILEDTGELLSATAKEKYGQGLSRLLNVVDGMIGQGLKVLALVTTNDELGDLHPAVTRPGRCAAQIAFGALTDEEAREWTGNEDAASGTIAELYAAYGKAEAADALPERDQPDDPEPEEASDLMAAAATDTVAAIQQVAEENAPDGGYGDTFWNADTATVFWVCADWTSNDEHDAAEEAFLSIDGVESVECEAEAAGPTGDGWEQVWPTPDSEAAIARVVALAARPLAAPKS